MSHSQIVIFDEMVFNIKVIEASSLTDCQDEKAISFIQAEKLYYENVLVDSSQLQKQIGNVWYMF